MIAGPSVGIITLAAVSLVSFLVVVGLLGVWFWLRRGVGPGDDE